MMDTRAEFTYSDLTRSKSMLIRRTIRKFIDQYGSFMTVRFVGDEVKFIVIGVSRETATSIRQALDDDVRTRGFNYYFKEEW